VGTGPYRFVAWERGKRIKLSRAPEPWGPPAAVDEIVFEIETDAVRALNRTRRGDIDILPRVLEVHYPDQVEPATLHDATTLYRLAAIAARSWWPTTSVFRWRRARFRRGLAAAVGSRSVRARAAPRSGAPDRGPLFGSVRAVRRGAARSGLRSRAGHGAAHRSGLRRQRRRRRARP